MFNVGDRVKVTSNYDADWSESERITGSLGTVISVNTGALYPYSVHLDFQAEADYKDPFLFLLDELELA